MAKGYPDFFGTSIWPKYGTILVEEDDLIVAGGAVATLFDIAIQGVISFGYILCIPVPPNLLFNIMVEIDGYTYPVYGPNDYNIYGWLPGSNLPLVLSYMEGAIHEASFLIGKEVPIHNKFKVSLDNNTGGNVHAYWNIGYYVVT
jgi:hypothetical protein